MLGFPVLWHNLTLLHQKSPDGRHAVRQVRLYILSARVALRGLNDLQLKSFTYTVYNARAVGDIVIPGLGSRAGGGR